MHAAALRRLCVPLLLARTATSLTTVCGTNRSASIDHVLSSGPLASPPHQLLPSRSSHATIHITASLHAQSCDTHPWRLFCWRQAEPQDMASSNW